MWVMLVVAYNCESGKGSACMLSDRQWRILLKKVSQACMMHVLLPVFGLAFVAAPPHSPLLLSAPSLCD